MYDGRTQTDIAGNLAGRDQVIAHSLRRLAGLLLDTPASTWLSTLGILWLVEDQPHTGTAVFEALQPVTSLLVDAPVNIPRIHALTEEGWLEPAPVGRGGPLYTLTPAGQSKLADLRRQVRGASQQALAAVAVDLDTCTLPSHAEA